MNTLCTSILDIPLNFNGNSQGLYSVNTCLWDDWSSVKKFSDDGNTNTGSLPSEIWGVGCLSIGLLANTHSNTATPPSYQIFNTELSIYQTHVSFTNMYNSVVQSTRWFLHVNEPFQDQNLKEIYSEIINSEIQTNI